MRVARYFMQICAGCSCSYQFFLGFGSRPRTVTFAWFVVGLFTVSTIVDADGQTVDSGSTGVDGALVLTTPGTILFNTADVGGDGIYDFTTITIGTGVTVELKANPLGTRPVTWLASGAVQIDGVLDLSGDNSHFPGSVPVVATGGAGGYEGGIGSIPTTTPTPGSGPGGGTVSVGATRIGAGGSFVNDGQSNTTGQTYGNAFLLPLIGGSGGGGTISSSLVPDGGGGGGGGGGALLIASSIGITLNGSINANGGNGGASNIVCSWSQGGGGSGGAIRLVAPIISGSGTISNLGGVAENPAGVLCSAGAGSIGRTRLEAFQHQLTGTLTNAGDLRIVTPGVILQSTDGPSLRSVTIGGVPIPMNTTGAFPPAEVTINSGSEVNIEIEAQNVPVGTIVNLRLVNETEGVIEFNSTPLAGTDLLSTATAPVTVPAGFSRFTLEATFTPP